MKYYHNPLFDRLFGANLIHPFGNPFKFEEEFLMEGDEIEEEVFETVKGDYKTTITCRFNKEGYMISCATLSEYIPSRVEEVLNRLETEKQEAIGNENYERASELQREINIIENQQKEGD